jgi:hypothetical protein
MSFAFTTIVIAALLDAKETDGKEQLSINSKEASWLGNTIEGIQKLKIERLKEYWLNNNVT